MAKCSPSRARTSGPMAFAGRDPSSVTCSGTPHGFSPWIGFGRQRTCYIII
ncbi:hypothetical protein DPMN_093213 [Dreissena polymorpha]|uniref:Uncharacterized protein n=1 Tax=Dreissena polymorpha TaxID=45954 RepID=A0A9D4R2C4_DREPO|nr:hypothetical protein DPMN_093213 [Dreissena polymorpha]